jgi:lipopolysaccharide transport system ATP-binding protein
MSRPAVTFEHVWKKFRRGERHDSLRDAITAAAKWPFTRPDRSALGEQEFWALRDVSFEVKPGEAVGIIGPNGAGKSTTLKLLTKILKPTKGSCRVHGRVGALIELAAGFHPDLTGRENLFLQGAILGMSRAEVARKLDAMIDFAGLHDFVDTPVKRYSSGMNARLGFAVAAHVDPDVLLIDEVLAVGDYAFQQKCYARLAEFRRSGAAIVLVSHSMQAIVSVCDRAVLLRPGRDPIIGPVGDVAALYASPQAQAVDPRIEIESMRLVERGGFAPLKASVRPGTHLTLDARIRTKVPLPNCHVEFAILRDDGLVMFHGGAIADGDKAIDLQAGEVLSCKTHFTTNMLRGTYRIVMHLVDGKVDKLWPAISISGLGSFVVHETTSVAGCAEITPSYELCVDDAVDEPARVLRVV